MDRFVDKLEKHMAMRVRTISWKYKASFKYNFYDEYIKDIIFMKIFKLLLEKKNQ